MGLVRQHATRIVGEGPETFLLAHGIGGTQDQWQPVVERLSEHARVVTFDLAGSGDCDPLAFNPLRHQSIMGFADDLAMLCSQLDLRGITCVGHSMSGMAAALASAADPGLFGQLIMIGASARYVDDPETGYVGGFSAEAIEEMLGAAAADFTLWSGGFAPYVMGNSNRPELAMEFLQSLRRYAPETAVTILRAAFTSDFRSFMPRVTVPTLVLQSTDDPAVPDAAAQWLAATIPNARYRQLPVTGHFPQVVDPDAVTDAIEDFCRVVPE